MISVPELLDKKRTELRKSAVEHLEAARLAINNTGDPIANFLVEQAIEELQSQIATDIHRVEK